jgi:hypothetical protein
MPLPRKPRPERRPGGSRSARRRTHAKTWLTAKITERFVRFAEILEQKRQQDLANGDFSGHEKAPDLSIGGSSSSED